MKRSLSSRKAAPPIRLARPRSKQRQGKLRLSRQVYLTSSSIQVQGAWCRWTSTTAHALSLSGLKTSQARSFLIRGRTSMIIFDGERASDSPFIERIWRSHSEAVNPFLSIAVNHCEFVVSRLQGKVAMSLRGPETIATPIGNAPAEGAWVGILLKLGIFLPHLPTSRLVDSMINLPTASSNSFWLGGSAWQFPDYENADIFVERLVRKGLLLRDPIVQAALQGQLNDLTPRAVQYRFVKATGITQSTARQI